MRGMILAAGLGTRLGSLTKDRPKALMPIDGQRTMLDIVVERLKSCGVTELMLNLHYKGELIREHVEQQDGFGISVSFSEEPVILGTGGGIRNVEDFFRDSPEFIVHNCDVYSDVDLDAMLEAHRKNKATVTLAVLQQRQDSYLVFDRAGSLIGWEMANGSKRDYVDESAEGQQRCYSGIQILSPSIFDVMRDEAPVFPIVSSYVKAARAGKLVQAFELHDAYWIDVGTLEKLEELRSKLQAGS